MKILSHKMYADRLNEQYNGKFKLLSQYIDMYHVVKLHCNQCGCEFERLPQRIRLVAEPCKQCRQGLVQKSKGLSKAERAERSAQTRKKFSKRKSELAEFGQAMDNFGFDFCLGDYKLESYWGSHQVSCTCRICKHQVWVLPKWVLKDKKTIQCTYCHEE
jgi:hypothetical protein